MSTRLIAALTLSLTAFAAGISTGATGLPEKSYPLPLEIPAHATLPAAEVRKSIDSFRLVLDSYPAAFTTEPQRASTFASWSKVYVDVRAAVNADPVHGEALAFLAELLRLGHSMDVENSATVGGDTLEACFRANAASVACHHTAAKLYLATRPEQSAKAEKSLRFLKEHYGTTPNEEVQKGYVFYYIARNQPKRAISQIDEFQRDFPSSGYRKMLAQIRITLAGP